MINIVILIGLIILSVIDVMTFNIKKGYIPSFLTTLFILFSFLVTKDTTMLCLAVILGLILTELNLWKGQADYKVFIAIGLSLGNIQALLIFALIMILLGIIMSLSIKKVSMGMPYIPVMLMGWLITLLI